MHECATGGRKARVLQACGVVQGAAASISRFLCPGTRNWNRDTDTDRNSLLREKVLPRLEVDQRRSNIPVVLNFQH